MDVYEEYACVGMCMNMSYYGSIHSRLMVLTHGYNAHNDLLTHY